MPPDPAPRPTLATLKRLARQHGESALKVLAEVAEAGSSEASRVAAALALLERGYGKPASNPAAGEAPRAPHLYQRIELVDGNRNDDFTPNDPARNDPG